MCACGVRTSGVCTYGVCVSAIMYNILFHVSLEHGRDFYIIHHHYWPPSISVDHLLSIMVDYSKTPCLIVNDLLYYTELTCYILFSSLLIHHYYNRIIELL